MLVAHLWVCRHRSLLCIDLTSNTFTFTALQKYVAGVAGCAACLWYGILWCFDVEGAPPRTDFNQQAGHTRDV